MLPSTIRSLAFKGGNVHSVYHVQFTDGAQPVAPYGPDHVFQEDIWV